MLPKLSRSLAPAGLVAVLLPVAVLAQGAVPEVAPADVEVVVTAPLPGSEVERAKVPTTPRSCVQRTCSVPARPARFVPWTNVSAGWR